LILFRRTANVDHWPGDERFRGGESAPNVNGDIALLDPLPGSRIADPL